MPPEKYRNKDEDIYEPVGSNKAPQTKNPQSMSNLSTSKDSMSSADTEDDLSMHTAHRPTFAKHGDTNVSLADFVIRKVIGRGSFGKVFLVQKKDSG